MIHFTSLPSYHLICAVYSNSIFFSYEIMLVGTIWKGYCGNRKA